MVATGELGSGGGGRSAVSLRAEKARASDIPSDPGENATTSGGSSVEGIEAPAKAGEVDAANMAGNCGQREGELNAGPEPSFCDVTRSAPIAQWCVP